MSDRRSPSKIPLPRSLLERYSVRGGGGGGGGRGRKEFRGQRREDEEEEEVVLYPLSVNELVVQPARSLHFQPAMAAVKQQQQLVATQSCLEPGSLTPEKLIATPQSSVPEEETEKSVSQHAGAIVVWSNPAFYSDDSYKIGRSIADLAPFGSIGKSSADCAPLGSIGSSSADCAPLGSIGSSTADCAPFKSIGSTSDDCGSFGSIGSSGADSVPVGSIGSSSADCAPFLSTAKLEKVSVVNCGREVSCGQNPKKEQDEARSAEYTTSAAVAEDLPEVVPEISRMDLVNLPTNPHFVATAMCSVNNLVANCVMEDADNSLGELASSTAKCESCRTVAINLELANVPNPGTPSQGISTQQQIQVEGSIVGEKVELNSTRKMSVKASSLKDGQLEIDDALELAGNKGAPSLELAEMETSIQDLQELNLGLKGSKSQICTAEIEKAGLLHEDPPQLKDELTQSPLSLGYVNEMMTMAEVEADLVEEIQCNIENEVAREISNLSQKLASLQARFHVNRVTKCVSKAVVASCPILQTPVDYKEKEMAIEANQNDCPKDAILDQIAEENWEGVLTQRNLNNGNLMVAASPVLSSSDEAFSLRSCSDKTQYWVEAARCSKGAVQSSLKTGNVPSLLPCLTSPPTKFPEIGISCIEEDCENGTKEPGIVLHTPPKKAIEALGSQSPTVTYLQKKRRQGRIIPSRYADIHSKGTDPGLAGNKSQKVSTKFNTPDKFGCVKRREALLLAKAEQIKGLAGRKQLVHSPYSTSKVESLYNRSKAGAGWHLRRSRSSLHCKAESGRSKPQKQKQVGDLKQSIQMALGADDVLEAEYESFVEASSLSGRLSEIFRMAIGDSGTDLRTPICIVGDEDNFETPEQEVHGVAKPNIVSARKGEQEERSSYGCMQSDVRGTDKLPTHRHSTDYCEHDAPLGGATFQGVQGWEAEYVNCETSPGVTMLQTQKDVDIASQIEQEFGTSSQRAWKEPDMSPPSSVNTVCKLFGKELVPATTAAVLPQEANQGLFVEDFNVNDGSRPLFPEETGAGVDLGITQSVVTLDLLRSPIFEGGSSRGLGLDDSIFPGSNSLLDLNDLNTELSLAISGFFEAPVVAEDGLGSETEHCIASNVRIWKDFIDALERERLRLPKIKTDAGSLLVSPRDSGCVKRIAEGVQSIEHFSLGGNGC